VAEEGRALLEGERHALDDDVGAVMVPVVALDLLDAAADALADPEIVVGPEEMAIAVEHILADRHHLGFREARIDPGVAERAEKALDVLLQAKGLAVEAARHVEDAVAVDEAQIAKRHLDFAFRHDLAVEPGDAFIAESHRSIPFAGLRDG